MSVTALITPWYRRVGRAVPSGSGEAGSVHETKTLNYRSPEVAALTERARAASTGTSTLDVLHAAHALIRDEIRPVYAL